MFSLVFPAIDHVTPLCGTLSPVTSALNSWVFPFSTFAFSGVTFTSNMLAVPTLYVIVHVVPYPKLATVFVFIIVTIPVCFPATLVSTITSLPSLVTFPRILSIPKLVFA